MTIDSKTLDELDALHAAATPGPWIAVGPEGDEKATDIVAEDSVYGVPVCELATAGIIDSWEPLERNRESIDVDARLIAAACNALPHLTARVRELEAQLAEASKDTERLDWMTQQRVYMAFSRDGEACRLVWPYGKDELAEPQLEEKGPCHSDTRAAIDAARGAK